MRKAIVSLVILGLVLGSCSPAGGGPKVPPEPTSGATQPATLPASTPLLPTGTATAKQTALPTSTSTLTPTPFSPVISAQTVSRLVEVGRIGKGVVRELAWSPRGAYLAVGTSVGIYIYSVDPLEEVNYIDAPMGVNALTYGADDETLVVAFDEPSTTIRIIDPFSGEYLGWLGNEGAEYLSYSSETNVLVSGHPDETVQLWNMGTGEHIRSWDPDQYLESVIVTADGNQVITGGGMGSMEPGVLEFWNTGTGELQRSIIGAVSGYPEILAASPDNSLLAVVGAGEIVVRSIPAGDYDYGGRPDGGVRDMIYSSDGQWLIVGTYNGTIQIWEAISGALERTI